jgi:peptidoglycan/LPS O-acetylase OafA/YrhL
VLQWRALTYVGIISYSMYLIHMSAIMLSQQVFKNRAVSFCVSLAATVLYATLCWYGFEKRLLKSSKKTSAGTLVAAPS